MLLADKDDSALGLGPGSPWGINLVVENLVLHSDLLSNLMSLPLPN